jgi:hypothetical protein
MTNVKKLRLGIRYTTSRISLRAGPRPRSASRTSLLGLAATPLASPRLSVSRRLDTRHSTVWMDRMDCLCRECPVAGLHAHTHLIL